MRRTHTHYDNLKVPRDASQEAIKHAYRRLSMRHHPDRNPGDASAVRKMALINKAYQVLSDSSTRKRHDEWIARQEHRRSTSSPRTRSHAWQAEYVPVHDNPHPTWKDWVLWGLTALLVGFLVAERVHYIFTAPLDELKAKYPKVHNVPFSLSPESPRPTQRDSGARTQ